MQIEEADLIRYANLLREIRRRVEAASSMLLSCIPITDTALDSAAVQIRKVLELIIFGSLITNRAAIEKIASAFHKKEPDDVLKLVRRVNPEFWPKPFVQRQEGPGRFVTDPVNAEVLSQSDWGKAYGFTSDLIHAANPYRDTMDINTALAHLIDIIDRIRNLLQSHQIVLVDRNATLFCSLFVRETGDVQVALFERIEQW